MSCYPTTQCFAYNEPSETVFYCVSCAKQKSNEPHNDYMIVGYHNQLRYIKCRDCGKVIKQKTD